MENIEIWRPVVGYDGLYEVSNIGRIKSLIRNHCKKEDTIMKPTKHCTGYHIIGLIKNKKQTIYRYHRIVAMAFCEMKDGCNIVNHKNGIKTDNRSDNLEWTTVSGNTLHSFKNGFQEVRRGEKSNLAILTKDQVLDIREKYKSGNYLQRELSDIYKVSRPCISNIVSAKNWKHI